MDSAAPNSQPIASPLARLRGLAKPRRAQERCELCGAIIPEEHQHLLELKSRQLACVCEACAILFSSDESVRYRRVPRRVQLLGEFQLSDETWENLHLPISLAFFYHNAAAAKVIAMYPSPAGATESLLPMDAWADLVQANPVLGRMQSDVEALLVNRVGRRREALLAPIDSCYQLVGVIRSRWRGLSGGKDVWDEIDRFFEQLQRRGANGKTTHA